MLGKRLLRRSSATPPRPFSALPLSLLASLPPPARGDARAASGMLGKRLVRRSSATPPRLFPALPLSLRPHLARDGHYSDSLLPVSGRMNGAFLLAQGPGLPGGVDGEDLGDDRERHLFRSLGSQVQAHRCEDPIAGGRPDLRQDLGRAGARGG